MRNKWLFVALLAVVVLLVGACAAPAAAPATGGEEAAASAEEMGPVTLDTVFSTEPPSLDPSLGTDSAVDLGYASDVHGPDRLRRGGQCCTVPGDRVVCIR